MYGRARRLAAVSGDFLSQAARELRRRQRGGKEPSEPGTSSHRCDHLGRIQAGYENAEIHVWVMGGASAQIIIIGCGLGSRGGSLLSLKNMN
jgi:hypothetical protein